MRIGLDQILADAAGADEADDGRAAHVDLEAQQRVARETGQDLRQHGEAHDRAGKAAPVASQPVDRLMSIFSTTSKNSLPSAPSEWIAIASTPGTRAEAEGDDEDQREDEIGHGAAEFEEAARRRNRSHGARPRLAAARKAQQECADRAQARADIGDQDRVAEQPQPCATSPRTIPPDRSRRARRCRDVRSRSK